jgi:hypothetical protein
MRNKLQAAVEYLENQLELVRRYAEGYPDKDNYTALADIYTTALDTTLSALRDALQRQPDPITGLVPCGCGGKAIIHNDWYEGNKDWVYGVACDECDCGFYYVSTDMQRAKDRWNTAMGYKGDV